MPGQYLRADVLGVEREHVFAPRVAHRAVYDERSRTFLETRKRMRPLYRRVNKGAQ